MKKERAFSEEKRIKPQRPDRRTRGDQTSSTAKPTRLASLHQRIGNRALQRLLAQRSGRGPTELDDGTAQRITRERSGGQPLPGSLQSSMGETMGADLSGVRVHTSRESDALSRDLGARAFTTGQDVFFREGAYDPKSSAGQELIAYPIVAVERH